MIVGGIIKKGEYYDSVSLMILSKELNSIDGVVDSAVVMGTKENRAILEASGLLLDSFSNVDGSDLLIVVKARTDEIKDSVLSSIEARLKALRTKSNEGENFNPRSIESALKLIPDANLALISVAGKYAAAEAMKALKSGLHVMLFSDNVSIQQEVELKQYAASHNLFVMGPDCGTAIVNGIPLAFANVVSRGPIGVVAASGTGLQEVS